MKIKKSKVRAKDMQQISRTLLRLTFVAILAGGEGTRLFPISHSMRPKQFCQLDKENTFIQATMQRFVDLGVKPTQVIVVTTNPEQTRLAHEQLKPLGALSQNILEINPVFGYAGAMVKAAAFIKALDENALVINTPADQFIATDEDFVNTVSQALESAAGGSPTLIGVKVNDLNTIMGCGHAKYDLAEEGGCKSVLAFVEKPDKKEADRLIRVGNSVCNTGINVWRVEDVLAAVDGRDLEAGLATDELMEALKDRLKIAFGNFAWYDCGTLKSIYDISQKTSDDKSVMLGDGDTHRHNCHGSLFVTMSDVELYVSGIKDAAVVVNEVDGQIIVAVVNLDDSQKVGKLAADYKTNSYMLHEDLSIGARNNIVSQTAISHEIVAMFVGVSKHTITTIKLADSRILISVSNDAM
jgi:mannose-1-phosphate guanylyltransferase